MVSDLSMAKKIRVLVADDHHVVRAGIRWILKDQPNMQVVAEATDGLEAEELALKTRPDVIIMDLFMPRRSGLEAMVSIKQEIPDVKVLFMTVSEEEEDLMQAIRLGAEGYLLKKSTIDDIMDAIRRVASGEAILSPSMTSKLMDELRKKDNEPSLSSREKEVLRLLADGLTNAQISAQLFLSIGTVSTYVSRLLEKLHVQNRAQAVLYATRHHPAGRIR